MPTPVSVSEEQITQYQRDGAILIKGFLSTEEQTLLQQGVEESYNNPGKRSTRASSPEGLGETFLETFPHQSSPSLKGLLDIGRIAELAGKLMRAASAQLILDQIFYKQKGHIIATPWHQDTPYLRVRGDDMIRIWVTADFSPKELTLQIVRGSHRWNVVYDPRLTGKAANSVQKTGDGKMFQMSDTTDMGPMIPDIEKYRDSFDILSWDVEPGDALIFNGNMLHAAGGAENYPHPRRAYTTMWAGPELQYIVPPDNALPTLAQVNGIQVPNGAKVGEYPDAFPLGWSQ